MLPIEKCPGCEACLNICKKEAITMEPDINGFLYPKIDNEKCIQCGLCEQRCPVLHSDNNLKEISFYAARYRDSEKLRNVSSGGLLQL